MPLTQYTLPLISATAGVVTIDIFSSTAGLTVPTVDTILAVGPLTETMDSALGISEVANLSLTVRDDYSTHTAGFWYNILNATTTYIRIYLAEGGSDTFYFYGTPQQDATRWTEASLFNSTYIRTADITLVSLLKVLMDTPTATWALALHANDTDSGERNINHAVSYISVLNAFDCMLSASGINASYASGDTTFVYGTQDIKFKYSGTDYRVDQLYFCTQYLSGAPAIANTVYFTVAGAGTALSERFATLKDLLANLLPNLGVGLRMNYDIAGGRHKIQLIQRARAKADAARLVFASKEIESTIGKSMELLGDSVRATSFISAPWWGAGYSTPINVFYSKKYYSGRGTDTEAPDYINFDFDLICIFRCADGDDSYTYGTDPGQHASRLFFALVGGQLEPIATISYYNYLLDDYNTATDPQMEDAMCGYVYYRFTSLFSTYTRRYGALAVSDGSTTSHQNVTIGARTEINDGVAAANYYANRITKDVMKIETEIEWFKE
jgi:hypothetical protein